MSEFKINPKRLNLLIRSNKLLDKTKINYKKYENERKILFEFTRNDSIDYDEWENFLTSLEKLINNK